MREGSLVLLAILCSAIARAEPVSGRLRGTVTIAEPRVVLEEGRSVLGGVPDRTIEIDFARTGADVRSRFREAGREDVWGFVGGKYRWWGKSPSDCSATVLGKLRPREDPGPLQGFGASAPTRLKTLDEVVGPSALLTDRLAKLGPPGTVRRTDAGTVREWRDGKGQVVARTAIDGRGRWTSWFLRHEVATSEEVRFVYPDDGARFPRTVVSRGFLSVPGRGDVPYHVETYEFRPSDPVVPLDFPIPPGCRVDEVADESLVPEVEPRPLSDFVPRPSSLWRDRWPLVGVVAVLLPTLVTFLRRRRRGR